MTTKYGAMASAVFASIVVAGVYFVRVSNSRKQEPSNRRKQEPPKLMRSMSMAVLHGGHLALKRLVEYHEARADNCALLDQAECDLKHILSLEHPNYQKLQSIIAKLEMSGKETEAITILENAITKAQNDGKCHEAYEIEMLLVEMLIYKGDFKKALERKCLSHEEISDARRPLYKAICTMLLKHEYNRKEAEQHWQDFNNLNKEFHCEPGSEKESLVESQLHKLKSDFREFEKVINVLRDDIEAHAKN